MKRKLGRCELDLEEMSSVEENRLLGRNTLAGLEAGSEGELLPSTLPVRRISESVAISDEGRETLRAHESCPNHRVFLARSMMNFVE